MAYTGYSLASYAYGQGPKDPYALQHNIAQTSPLMTDVQYDEQCGGGGVSLSSSSHTYASTPSPIIPTGNLHLGGYSTVTKTEFGSSSLTHSQWDSQFPTFNQPDSMRWTPSTLGWMPNSELLNRYKFIVRNSKEPYFQLMDPWTPTQQTPAKVYLDNPE
jgi:hypothetical protein